MIVRISLAVKGGVKATLMLPHGFPGFSAWRDTRTLLGPKPISRMILSYLEKLAITINLRIREANYEVGQD
jgi:hypothetical protein